MRLVCCKFCSFHNSCFVIVYFHLLNVCVAKIYFSGGEVVPFFVPGGRTRRLDETIQSRLESDR